VSVGNRACGPKSHAARRDNRSAPRGYRAAAALSSVVLLWGACAPSTLALSGNAASERTLRRDALISQIELTRAQRDQAAEAARSAKTGDSLWRSLIPISATLVGALVTAVVAYLAVVMPLRAQREKDRLDRRDADALEATRRDEELAERFDANFASAVAALAGPTPAAQAGGAAALRSFLRPELAAFHDQTYEIARAHLDEGIEHVVAVRSVLVSVLAELLRIRRGAAVSPDPRTASTPSVGTLDLVRVWLQRANLADLDLSHADFWRSDLSNARFAGASLVRSRGWKANLSGSSFRGADLEEARFRGAKGARATFDGARLVSARFEEAVLDKASFRGAQLQSAHFDGAKLRGAVFRDANVADASFLGAKFDDDALASLVLAHGLWVADDATARGQFGARLDASVETSLLRLAEQHGWNWVPA
jgi:hypothetical protein